MHKIKFQSRALFSRSNIRQLTAEKILERSRLHPADVAKPRELLTLVRESYVLRNLLDTWICKHSASSKMIY